MVYPPLLHNVNLHGVDPGLASGSGRGDASFELLDESRSNSIDDPVSGYAAAAAAEVEEFGSNPPFYVSTAVTR